MQPNEQAGDSGRPHASQAPRVNRTGVTTAATILAAGLCAAAPATAQETTLVNKSGEWSLYSHTGQNPICFLTSQARETEPKGQRRASHFYITSWVSDGVKQEISVNLGTALQPGSAVQVAIGAAKFKLFAQGDKAFITDAKDEPKLVAALRKGNFMSVDATAASGTALKDKFSLIGISGGLQNLSKGCS